MDGGREEDYLSAPGREVATFGRGGGAGGFELNYRAKTKKGQEKQMTEMNILSIHMDKTILNLVRRNMRTLK